MRHPTVRSHDRDVVPRMLFPDYQSGAQIAAIKSQPDPPYPALAKAITAWPALEGDTGVGIGQQDRVTFMPAAPGSIPLRVNAVDLMNDLKARNIGNVIDDSGGRIVTERKQGLGRILPTSARSTPACRTFSPR